MTEIVTVATVEELVETGIGALVLVFGLLVSWSIYLTGSLEAVPLVFDRFIAALAFAMVPTIGLASWPTALALIVGVGAAIKTDDRLAVRGAAFLATYLVVAVFVYYVVGA